MELSQTTPKWRSLQRIFFRFAFSYLVLYNFPFPLDVIPVLGEVIAKPYIDLWNAVVPWVGKHLFHVTITVRPNGSGDTTYNYVQVFCYLVIALAAAAVWTLLDRRRTDDSRLAEGLRVYVRFALAAAMISYGAIKAVPAQFPPPGLYHLIDTFGEMSPMGLLWTFIGASPSYSIFCGLTEMLGGLLLTVRRTALLGALIAAAALSNVVILNFSYDVPVKLYSSHLLAMAVFLILPDLRRLAGVFLLHRPVEPAAMRPLLAEGRFRRAAPALIAVLVVAYTGYNLYGAYDGSKQYGFLAPKPPLYGVWNVEDLVIDGTARPPLLTEKDRWRRVIVDYPGYITVQLMDGSKDFYQLTLGKKRLVLGKFDDREWKRSFRYAETAPGLLAMEGTLDGKLTQLRLRRAPESSFLINGRGFHWINEFPFNH
jgi:hypothetical protein